MEATKQELREKYRALRDSMTAEQQKSFSEIIRNRLSALASFQKSRITLIYYTFGKEVDTRGLFSAAHGKFLVPISGERELTLSEYSQPLGHDRFGIPIPKKIRPFIHLKAIDVAIVPGIVFDKAGFRIGFGGGFFDRFLKKLSCPVIGLAYDFQIIEKLPHDPYDVPVDGIITEKRTIRITPGSV